MKLKEFVALVSGSCVGIHFKKHGVSDCESFLVR